MHITVDDMMFGLENGFMWEGIKVYPMLVNEYEKNIAALDCLLIMHQAMPIEFLGIPYLRMLHESAAKMPEVYGSHLFQLRDVFAKSFHVTNDRLAYTVDESGRVRWYVSFAPKKVYEKNKGYVVDSETEYEKIDLNTIRATNDKDMLKAFGIYVIDEANFMPLRELICEINGQTVPDETVNLDIWQSANDIRRQNAVNIEYSFKTLLFSVSVASHISVSELCKKSIWEFLNIAEACDRYVNYIINSVAQISGVKYKNGNPCPDWRYNKSENDFMGLISYSEMSGKLGKVADIS